MPIGGRGTTVAAAAGARRRRLHFAVWRSNMKHALLAMFLAMPLAAAAQEFGYDYVEGSYGYAESTTTARASISTSAPSSSAGHRRTPSTRSCAQATPTWTIRNWTSARSRRYRRARRAPAAISTSTSARWAPTPATRTWDSTATSTVPASGGIGPARPPVLARGDRGERHVPRSLLGRHRRLHRRHQRLHRNPERARPRDAPPLARGGYAYAFDSETETLSASIRYDY